MFSGYGSGRSDETDLENHRSKTGGSLTGLDHFFKGYTDHTCPEETSYMELLLDFQDTFPEWQVQKEQLLVYWLYTYFCGAVYDEKIFAKGKMAVICTLFIEELVLGLYARKQEKLESGDLVSVCYRFSRELEHSDQNLNTLEELLDQEEVFSLEHLMTLCSI